MPGADEEMVSGAGTGIKMETSRKIILIYRMIFSILFYRLRQPQLQAARAVPRRGTGSKGENCHD